MRPLLRWIVPSLGLLLACADDQATPAASAPRRLAVWGQDMGVQHQNVLVLRDGLPVSGAQVDVNGQALLPLPGEAGLYTGSLPKALGAGERLTLEVRFEGASVRGVAAVPEAPVLTAPADGATFPASGALEVTWESASDPDRFEVVALWSCGSSCGAGAFFPVAGGARALEVPVDQVPAGVPVTLAVFAYDAGALEGDYLEWSAYPGMNVRSESARVVLVR